MADWDAQARATGVQPVVLEPLQLELFSDESPEVPTDAADAYRLGAQLLREMQRDLQENPLETPGPGLTP